MREFWEFRGKIIGISKKYSKINILGIFVDFRRKTSKLTRRGNKNSSEDEVIDGSSWSIRSEREDRFDPRPDEADRDIHLKRIGEKYGQSKHSSDAFIEDTRF